MNEMPSQTWREFFHQCRWVLWTYLTRPAAWGVAAVVALYACGHLWFISDQKGSRDRSLPMVMRPMHSWVWPQGEELRQLSLLFARQTPQSIRSLSYSLTLPRTPGKTLLPNELNQMDHMQSFKLQGLALAGPREIQQGWTFDSQDIRLFDKAPLNHMEFTHCLFAPGTLADLGRKHDISKLSIDQESLTGHIEELREFKLLQHLELKNVPLNAELIATVRQLPQLRILSIKDVPAGQLTQEALLPLRDHPTLTWVFADWSRLGLAEDGIREVMRPVRALPEKTSRSSTAPLIFSQFLMLAAMLLIMLQLHAQFSPETSMLVPRFAAPHLVVPMVIISLALLASLANAFLSTGLPTLPIVALNLYFVALVSVGFLAGNVVGGAGGRFFGMFIYIIGYQLGTVWLGLIFEIMAARMYWFLLGEQPLLTVGIIAWELSLAALACWRLRTLSRSLAEQSPAAVRMGNFCRPQDAACAPTPYAPNWMLVRPKHLGWHGGNAAKRRALWQAGMNFQPVSLVKGFFVVCPVVLLVEYLFYAPPTVLRMTFLMIANMLGLMAPLFTIQSWTIRMALVQQEFVHPINRRDFASDLILTYLRSCWPVLLALLPTFGIDLWVGTPLLTMFAKLTLALGCVTLCLSLTLLHFAMPRRWWTGVVIGLASVLPMQFLMVGNTIAADALSAQANQFNVEILLTGLVLLAAGGLLGYWLYGRTVEREWGMT